MAGNKKGRDLLRLVLAWLLALCLSRTSWQEFSGLARLDVGASSVTDLPNEMAVTLYLSQPVPFRVFTLRAPCPLYFREVDWHGATRDGLLHSAAATWPFGTAGPAGPGWWSIWPSDGRPAGGDDRGRTARRR